MSTSSYFLTPLDCDVPLPVEYVLTGICNLWAGDVTFRGGWVITNGYICNLWTYDVTSWGDWMLTSRYLCHLWICDVTYWGD